MTINYIPLDKEKHKDLKVNLKHDFSFAKDTHLAAVTLREFPQVASAMPLVFVKDNKAGSVHAIAMLGTEQNVNMFMHDGKWQSHAIPMNVVRYPFDVRPDGEKLGVFIDENSPLVGKEGEPLFTAEGEATPFLQNRQQLLADLANSEIASQRFTKALTDMDLLQPMQIHIEYVSGERRTLNGIITINETKLAELADDKVLELHKAGFLAPIYTMLTSLGQLNRLVQLSANTDKPIKAMQLALEKKTEAA